jgi:hypothetical protein
MLEAHHRRGDRDTALAPRPVHRALNFARQLDRPAKHQQLLSQCRLAGVRVRNDRKGAPAQNLVGRSSHLSALVAAAARPVAGKRSGSTDPIIRYNKRAPSYSDRQRDHQRLLAITPALDVTASPQSWQVPTAHQVLVAGVPNL